MKVTFRTFYSGSGDCIFLRLDDYVIMIDCGKFTDEIENYVVDALNMHINLLIVTHIDYDHVDGVTAMLNQMPDLSIDKILFNCYQKYGNTSDIISSDSIKQIEQQLKANIPSSRSVIGKINMEHACTLAETILKNPKWNSVWERSYITNEYTDPLIPVKYGKLVVLSPTKNDLDKIDNNFAHEYFRLTKHRLDENSSSSNPTLFELVSKLVLLKGNENQSNKKISFNTLESIGLWTKAKDYTPETMTIENKASIAFVWEYGQNRILFLGDAEPEVVAKSLKSLYGTESIKIDAVKVSHHGSKHSTSNDLIQRIDCNHYFITGGNHTKRPSLESIAKIVMRDGDKRIIHYNYPNNDLINKLVKSSINNIGEYKFEITDQNELSFEY